MEYVIGEPKEEKSDTTQVWLGKCADGTIVFRVGKWDIFKLFSNGKGKLSIGIPAGNREGLQVGKNGKIELVE